MRVQIFLLLIIVVLDPCCWLQTAVHVVDKLLWWPEVSKAVKVDGSSILLHIAHPMCAGSIAGVQIDDATLSFQRS